MSTFLLYTFPILELLSGGHPAPPPPPAPIVVVAPVRAAAPVGQPVVAPAAPVVAGHYDCGAVDQADQYATACTADNVVDPGPNNLNPNSTSAFPASPAGDQPGHTLGSTNATYGDRLDAEYCAAAPWRCDPTTGN